MVHVPVLVYHAICAAAAADTERWTVSPAEFAQHLDVIEQSGRRALTISELADCLRGERRLDGDAVAITFDDGYADTPAAVDALLRRDMTATVYVISGAIGATGMLSGDDLRRLAGLQGVELGAHSVTHPRLDELAGARLEAEVAGSRRALESLVDSPVASFAYPHGAYDRRARAAVVAAGYRSAAAVKNAISHLDDDPFAIARVMVEAGTSAERLAAVLRGDGVPLAWRRERMRTRAFRTLRRARRALRERSGAAPR